MPTTKTRLAEPAKTYLQKPLTLADLIAACERLGYDPEAAVVVVNGRSLTAVSEDWEVVRERGEVLIYLSGVPCNEWDED